MNGSLATIVVSEYNTQIVIDRSDYAGGATGLTAHYVGARSASGVSGTVTWTFNGSQSQGHWFANWTHGQGCSMPEDAGPGGSFGPPPGGWSLEPLTWSECEPSGDSAGCAVWTWSDATQEFSAASPDGGTSDYTLAAYDAHQLVADLVGDAGLSAHYVGVRLGNDVAGSVTYGLDDGGTQVGTWSATW